MGIIHLKFMDGFKTGICYKSFKKQKWPSHKGSSEELLIFFTASIHQSPRSFSDETASEEQKCS